MEAASPPGCADTARGHDHGHHLGDGHGVRLLGYARAMTAPKRPAGAPAGRADHVHRNRAAWDADADAYQARNAATLAADGSMAWGVWHVPESRLRALGEVGGRDILEFGCGGARWSVALAQAGARVVGLDLSERQLAHARRHIEATGVRVPLVQASAEAVPLADASFDIV